MEDGYGNKFSIIDKRKEKTVVLEGDYVEIHGEYSGLYKVGDVYPEINGTD